MSTKKVSNLLSNIFTRKKSSNLETDAVPISDNGISTEQQNCDNNQENLTANNLFETSNNNNNNNVNNTDSSIINNDIQNFDTISSSSSILNANNSSDDETASSLAIATTTATTTTNNINNLDNNISNLNHQMNMMTPNTTNNTLAVNNTHGHVVYQFSNIDGLHIGHVINVQNNNGTDSKNIPINCNKTLNRKYQEQQLKPKTSTIQKMMECKEILDHKMIDIISTHLGEGWKDIMRKLNYSDGQIHQTYIYYKDEGLKEVIYQLLLDWSRNDDNATLGEITTILWKAGQRNVVHDMKNSLKKYNSTFCNNDKKTNKNDNCCKIENESEI